MFFSFFSQTDEGLDLLPVNRRIAFDCPDEGAGENEIFVGITDPGGRSVHNSVRSNRGSHTFTCEFTTTQVGEHHIEIVLGQERLNVTPR